jgi:hypothetical protein
MTTDYTALIERLRAPMWRVEPIDIRDLAEQAATALRDLQAKLAEAERLGDTLAHCLIHSQDGWALDKWWAMRGHDNCTVCNSKTPVSTEKS